MSGAARIAHPVVDLLRAPGGTRERQLLYGESVAVLSRDSDWAEIRASKDGYTGHVATQALAAPLEATHWVSAPATHAYEAADFKSRDLCALSFGSRLQVSAQTGRFAETELGHIPKVHLSPIGTGLNDPVTVAEKFLGTPYLWGGNSRFGIDCSGLVQAALLACGIPCPGDSGPQERELGTALPAASGYERGDLLFWKGHVALVRDPDHIIHANAHDMAVAIEPLEAAILRILEQGDGPVTAHKRLG
ncbi:NlpC/P60 family protein [Phaeobacter sp. QD34_3]|uniref:C40 family peptidase n=1 Tax=unclassified Phaeobacter TaxID=2621772 RepID=UPI00237F0137|nr:MULTISPECIES: NlpC/P60 family protein [unclassified Phaeobacter]MDE4133462.1 NlpC/P60 family protein [Phaeobacter sp. QD34_3]MDE4137098.1 NlpC/P60 family protein [Phaeobacter sp. QD34_24]MDE4175298.1 NlpC/P60 family protein [Phaeobacter sp. PT47_59]